MKNSVSVEQRHTIIPFSDVPDIFQSWKHYTLEKSAVNNGPKYTRDCMTVFCVRLFSCIEGLSTACVHVFLLYMVNCRLLVTIHMPFRNYSQYICACSNFTYKYKLDAVTQHLCSFSVLKGGEL